VDARHRGLAFGVHRALDNAGAVIGPLAAAALLAAQVPIRDILLWTALPGALTVLLALSLREPRVPPAPAAAGADWTWRGLPPAYRRLLATIAVFTAGQASNTFMLLRATDLGLGAAQVALLWALVSGVSTLLAVPLSAWSDRVGRTRLMIAGWLLYVAVFVLLGQATETRALWAAAVLMGVYLAATEGAERALIADLVAPGARGTAYGWYYLVKGLLLLPASALFGLVWHVWGAGWAFGLGAVLVLLAAGLLALWVAPGLQGTR
jgi:MFS family permease